MAKLQRRAFALVPLPGDKRGQGGRLLRQCRPYGDAASLMTFPFVAAIVAAGRDGEHATLLSRSLRSPPGFGWCWSSGLSLNGSLAGYGLALPVIAASVLLILAGRAVG